MNLAREIKVLVQKEFLLELRNKYAIGGILLYVFSTIFIIYAASVGNVALESWNTLFWIIVLFASVNAILKSFIPENSNQQLYYYTLVNPMAIILSKILYNTALLLVLCFLTWVFFGFIVGDAIKDSAQFALVLLLASMGFSITFTFTSAISAKANNSATLMAILSFPITIPILLTLIKLSANAMRMIQDTSIRNDIFILIAIDLILLALCFLLFPFLWRD